MSALRWTTTKPKRSGIYWARWLDGPLEQENVLVMVDLDMLDHSERCVRPWTHDGGLYPLNYFKLWSAEPIPEPEGF